MPTHTNSPSNSAPLQVFQRPVCAQPQALYLIPASMQAQPQALYLIPASMNAPPQAFYLIPAFQQSIQAPPEPKTPQLVEEYQPQPTEKKELTKQEKLYTAAKKIYDKNPNGDIQPLNGGYIFTGEKSKAKNHPSSDIALALYNQWQ